MTTQELMYAGFFLILFVLSLQGFLRKSSLPKKIHARDISLILLFPNEREEERDRLAKGVANLHIENCLIYTQRCMNLNLYKNGFGVHNILNQPWSKNKKISSIEEFVRLAEFALEINAGLHDSPKFLMVASEDHIQECLLSFREKYPNYEILTLKDIKEEEV